MINKNWILIGVFVGMLFIPFEYCYAQSKEDKPSEPSIDLLSLRNPFESRLPRKEEPKKAIKEKRIQKPKQLKPKPRKPQLRKPQPEIKQIRVPKPDSFKEVEEIKVPLLSISGLVWNSKRPQAIVNGEVVGIGDVIQGVEILNIHKFGLDVVFSGQKMTLTPKSR